MSKFFKKTCTECHGKGFRGEPHPGWWYENPCSFCKGTKEQVRWGRILLIVLAAASALIIIL